MRRTAFVDDQAAARNFHTGDVVRRTGVRGFLLSPYVGRVVYANVATGKVQVDWPWGEEQESASELIKDVSGHFEPTSSGKTDLTWEASRNIDGKDVDKANAKWRKSLASSIVTEYERRTVPLWQAACEAWHCQMPEMDAYLQMASVFAPEYGDDAVRVTVANLYGLGRRVAIYWKDQNRRYKVTQQESNSGKIGCPRCKGVLKPRVFRQGEKVLSCKGCGFSIHPQDLIRPGSVPAQAPVQTPVTKEPVR